MTQGRGEPAADLLRRPRGAPDVSPWPAGGYSPPTDIFATEDTLVVRMELPGIDPRDVEVTTRGRALVVSGRRSFPRDDASVQFIQRGAFYGEFTSRIELGGRLDLQRVSARYDNGMLEIGIPYVPEEQPRRIEIEEGGG
jgi:HSP20 family protein